MYLFFGLRGDVRVVGPNTFQVTCFGPRMPQWCMLCGYTLYSLWDCILTSQNVVVGVLSGTSPLPRILLRVCPLQLGSAIFKAIHT